MLRIYSREDVIQNLKDAGCSEKTIGSFLVSFDKNVGNDKMIQALPDRFSQQGW